MKSSTAQTQPKTTINPNIPPFIPQTQNWSMNQSLNQRQYMPTPPIIALPPNTGPSIWSQSVIGAPLTTGYGFYGQMTPRFNQFPPNHSMHCCLNTPYNARHHCHPCDHSCGHWGPNGGHNGGHNGCGHNGNSCWNQSFDANPGSNVKVESIVEVRASDSEDEGTKSETKSINGCNDKSVQKDNQKELKKLKKSFDVIDSQLKERSIQLRQTQENLLKMSEQMANDYLENYCRNLKRYGDYMREECNRFYNNEEMATKLMDIGEQINKASNIAVEEKAKLKKSFEEQLKRLSHSDVCDIPDVDLKRLPEYPDLMSFYKCILDEIPLVFLSDLTQLKRFGNQCIQKDMKNKMNDNLIAESLAQSMPFSDNPMASHSSDMFFSVTAPDVKELPKPDLSIFDNNVLPLKPALKPNTSTPQASLEMTFAENPLPQTFNNSFTNSILDDWPPVLHMNAMKEKPISPIGKPIQSTSTSETVDSYKTFSQKRSQNDSQPIVGANQMPLQSKDTVPKQLVTNAISCQSQTHGEAMPETSGAAKLGLTQSQSKLLAKLKEVYIDLSDDILIDCMAQTKKGLIDSGNPKGFSGMKVSVIIKKISEYIDLNVNLLNTFAKTHVNNGLKPPFTDKNKIIEKPMPTAKAWNAVNRKQVNHDGSQCAICFDRIQPSNTFETECHHFFHSTCISNWIRKDSTCPICRCHVLPPEEYPQL